MESIDSKLSSPEFFQEPYILYNQLQKESPILYIQELKTWMITRYEDIVQGLNNNCLTADRGNSYFWQLAREDQEKLKPLKVFLSKWLLFSDGEYHKKLRTSLIKSSFFKSISKYEELLNKRAQNILISKVSRWEKIDILNEYAIPISMEVLSCILGVDQKDFPKIIKWTEAFINFIWKGNADKDFWYLALEAYFEFESYIDLLILKKEKLDYGNNLMEDLLKMYLEKYITKEELIATLGNILIDWYEPSALSISQWIRLLNQNNFTYNDIQDSNKKWLQEIFRIEPTFMCAARRVERDTFIWNIQLWTNDRVLFVLGAGNYDENIFEKPFVFNIHRENIAKHLTFWIWHHRCIWMWLAYSSVEIWIKNFMKVLQNKNIIIEEPIYRKSIGLRAFNKLTCMYYDK